MPTYDLRCPSCQTVFEWLFLKANRSDGPKFCPQCGVAPEEAPERLPSAPHIENHVHRSADYVYRADEEASKHRAEVAAESFGMDKGAAASLVTTDYGTRGNTRPGDVVAMPVVNEASRMIASAPNVVGHVTPSTASGYAASAHDGYLPFRGLQAREVNKRNHGNMTIVSPGAEGMRHYKPPVTDNPALEVINRDSARQVGDRIAAARRGR